MQDSIEFKKISDCIIPVKIEGQKLIYLLIDYLFIINRRYHAAWEPTITIRGIFARVVYYQIVTFF